MADSRRKAPSSQPWKYVSRIQAAQENREALEVMARAAKERLATGDVRGSREALAQASPNTVTRSKAKGFNIMEEVGNRLRQARPEAAFAHDKKLVTNALADKARRIVSGDSKLVPAPTVEPPRIKKKDFSITRLAGDVSHYAAAMNPVGNIVEGVDIARDKADARERWLATISGEKFQDRLGIGTRYMDRLREQGVLGEVASGVIDTATAPATYIPGVGPIGGGASVTSKVGAKILARRAAAELVGGGLGMPGARIAQEQTAKHTDNPWLALGAGVAGGLIGGVGGYTGVEHAGGIARTGVRGAKALDRGATAADAALLRKFPKLSSAEAGEFRMGGAEEPSAIPDPPGTRQLEPGEVRAYHYTSAKNAERIRKEGLTPQAEGNSAKAGEPAMVWGYEESHGRAKNPWEIIPQNKDEVVVEYITRPEEGDFLKPGSGQVASTRAVPPEDIIAVHEPWEARYRYMKEEGLDRAQLEEAANIADETYSVAAKRRLSELDAEEATAPAAKPRAASFEDEVFETYETNPMNPREVIIGDTVVELGGRGWIKSIRSMKQGEGEGSKALKELTDLADKHGTTLTLDVVPTGKGGLSKKALKSWYERNGFVMEEQIGNTKAEDYWVGTREPKPPVAAFDPDDTNSYFNYQTRAQAAKATAPDVEGIQEAGRAYANKGAPPEGWAPFDQEGTMRRAEAFFEGAKRGKNGNPVGLPEGIKTPEDFVAMHRKAYDAALAGEEGRFWYSRSGRAVLDAFGGDQDAAEKFLQLVGIYSSKTPVGPNMNNALRAWAQWQAEGVIRVARGDQDKAAMEVMQGIDWGGRKTNSFYTNLVGYINPEKAKDVATVDRHIGTFYGFPTTKDGSVAFTDAQYSYVENDLRALGEHLGWNTDQVQAAIWVVEKAAKDGVDIGTSKFDFANALEERMAQVSWETAPGKTSGVLPGYFDAPIELRTQFHRDLSAALLDDDGNDMIAKRLGATSPGGSESAGVFWKDGELQVNPGTQTKFVAPKAPQSLAGKPLKENLNRVAKEARDVINTWAAIRGYVLRQDAMAWTRPFPVTSLKQADGRAFRMGRTLTSEEAGNLTSALGEHIAVIPTDDGFWLRNLPTSPLDNESFHNLANAKVGEVIEPDTASGAFKADGDYVENKWHTGGQANGEGYRSWAVESGRSDIFEWARQVLEPRVQAVWADYAERYGWDAPTHTSRGLSGEAGSANVGLAAQLAATLGGAAYGYSTGDDAEDRWKKALSFGIAGAVGGTTLRLAAGGMGGRAGVLPGPTPTPKTSVLASLPEEAIESRQVIRGGRERIIPKVGHAGADKAIAIKREAARAPGRISQALPPVLNRGAALLNPAKVMDLPVLVAWRARQATKAQLMGEFNTHMTPFVEALEGMHAQVIYSGPEPNARTAHIIGTWKDIFDRPEVYTMTPAAREAIDNLEAASWDFVSGRARAEYGVEVMPYTAQGKTDFAYLPTIARKADMDDKLDSALDGISTSRRAKRRGYQTAYDRMMADADFEPETDLRQLVTTLNEAMATNAGDAVLKRGAGGKALAEVIDELHPGLRKTKLHARANMIALNARAKEALLSKNRILRETHLSDTELRAVEARMAPITDRVNALTEADEFGIELSYLSGQQRELEILRAKILKNIETKEGRAAWQDVRLDKVLADITDAHARVEDLVRAYESAGTGSYVMDPGTHKWYTPEGAKTMQKLLSKPAGVGKHAAELADEIRAWHLAGDFSPLTIQGVMGVILDPLTAWKALRQVNGDPLKVLQRIQDQEFGTVSDYSFSTGRRFGLQLPEYSSRSTVGAEGRRGVGRIPGVGKVEDTMFAVIQIMQFQQWKNDRALLQGWNPGMSDGLAGQESASSLSKLIPGLDPSERGISPTRGAVERMAMTSASFVAAPAMAAADAGTGYLKLAKVAMERLARSNSSDPRSAWQTLSGREQLAIRRTFQATGTVMGLAAMSAALSAESRNMSVEDAIRETWDTDSRYFMAVQLGEGRSIPIGGPFRSAIKAIVPDRNGVPFGNLPSWAGTKINSPIRAPIDVLARNKDFYGDPIYEGNLMRPENIMRALWYGSEAVMPVALSEASEAIRKQDKPMDEAALAVVGQFAGTNYNAVSPNEKLDDLARGQFDGKDFYDLLPKEQDQIKKANPSLWNQAVAKGSDARQKAEALKAEVKEDQEADDKLLLDGKLSLDDWEKGRSDRQNQLVGAERAIYSDSNFTGKKTNPTLQKYYDAIDDATTNGRVDWDEVQAFRDQLSDRENKLIDENTGLRKTKLEKLRSDVSSEYYDLPRYRGYTADEARAIDELWQEVRNNSRSADDANMLSALRKMDTEGVDDEILKAVKKRIVGTLTEDTARSRWARAHPEVAIIQRQGKLTPADVAAIEAAMR